MKIFEALRSQDSHRELIERLIEKYEKYVAPFTFVTGFIFDAFTIQKVSLEAANVVLLVYIIITASCIAILTAYQNGFIKFRRGDEALAFVPVVMQFALGNLFSAFVLFYTKSAAYGRSWLFLLALGVILVGNERFRKKYERFVFRISVFFIAFLSYAIFAVPFFTGRIGTISFLWSGAISLAFIVFFILVLSPFFGERALGVTLASVRAVVAVYAVFLILYFSNVIPPAPLSLKEGGVYHSVRRSGDSYLVTYEPASRFMFFRETNSVFHKKPGEPVYYFSSVFTPVEISTGISHRWSKFDETGNKWIVAETVSFPITGGRDGGYRGYSFKTSASPGRWRVDVMTANGQILSRENFTVLGTFSTTELTSGTK